MVVDRLRDRIKTLTAELDQYKSGQVGPGAFQFPPTRPDDNDLNSGGAPSEAGGGGGAGSGMGGGGESELRELFANLELSEYVK